MPLEITSIFDKVAQAVSPVLRKLSDIRVKQVGTKTSVLRITKTSQNVFGDQSLALETSVIDDVILYYPFKDVEIFATKDSNQTFQTQALDIVDLLPITMQVQFVGNASEDAFSIKKNDIVVDSLLDENNNILPIIMQVTRLRGSFNSKFVVKRSYELTLVREQIEDDIQAEIDNYIASL